MRRPIKPVVPPTDTEWHWLYKDDRVDLFQWHPYSRMWTIARWTIFYGPADLAKEGWSYLQPCVAPAAPAAEQAALDLTL